MTDEQSLFRLDGLVAVLTGASSGIGRHFAEILSAAGATVIAAARRRDRLEQLAATTPNVIPIVADVTDEEQAELLIGSALSVSGRIDILINNAGAITVMAAEDEIPSIFRRVIDVNLIAPFMLARLAGGHMLLRGRGSIVNVASILGIVGSGRIPQASYAASKGGLISLTRELAAQWSGRGVRVNCLAPGWFPSEMTADMLAHDEGRQFIERSTLMKRVGNLSELDGALLFLAGSSSSYVTGQVLVVDGGWTAI